MLTNQRILAQQGCFTLHGTEKKSIDEYFDIEPNPTIVKIILSDNSYRDKLLTSLYSLGFKEDNVYQDLDSLSSRIVRERQ
jgi:hypothetical protein